MQDRSTRANLRGILRTFFDLEETMKAAIMVGANEPVEIHDIAIDQPGPREVLIRTGASGVCHSELHFLQGLYSQNTPTVLGHEGAGTVEKVGELVSYVKPGDRVITCLSSFCGNCERCLSGRPNMCMNKSELERESGSTPRLSKNGEKFFALSGLGTHAEQMLVHENATVKIEGHDDIPYEELALVGCGVMTGIGAAINTADVEVGATVAVIGCGGVGLNVIQGANLANAGKIIAIDREEVKLGMAMQMGATDVVDASVHTDISKRIFELTDGQGVDYSFEVIGLKETAEAAFHMLRRGGTATLIGMVPQGTMLEIPAWSWGERRIQHSSIGSNRFRVQIPQLVDLYARGKIKLGDLVSQTMPLADINQAFEDMQKGQVARTVLTYD